MDTESRDLLTGQVRDHLKALPVKYRVRELIYNHFMSQCDQYEISEDEFYKQVLKSAFRDAEPAPEEDPDPVNRKGTFVTLFGVTLHSLKRLGAVLFEEPGRAQVYFEDVTLLKAHVDALADADVAIGYARIYQAETDVEKRYLKICYKLNPDLPYRIAGELFATPEDLFVAGFKSRALMNKIYKDFVLGKLQIWLPDRFGSLLDDPDPVSFLRLIYGIDAKYPYFIGQELFHSPEELVSKAQRDLDLWAKLIAHCSNGTLFVWFDALGHQDWREKFREASLAVGQDEHALIQQLLFILEPETSRPLISASETKIELLDIPAAQPVAVQIQLHLQTSGFVQLTTTLEAEHEGIRIDQSQISLFDLAGQTQSLLTLHVAPQQLTKNLEYRTVLRITTPYETLRIPVCLKAVFPLRSFWIYVVKYGAFGAAFFGFFRWVLAAGTGSIGSLAPLVITNEIGRSLPDNYPMFYWVFVAMLTAFILSVLAVRKVEKI